MIRLLKALWLRVTCDACWKCHERKWDVKESQDPFLAEVLHIYRDMPFCQCCLNELDKEADKFYEVFG